MGHTHSKTDTKPAVRSDRDIDINSEPDLLPELDEVSEDDNCSEPDTALADRAKDHSTPKTTPGMDFVCLPDLQRPRRRTTQNRSRQQQAAIALATCHELYPDAHEAMLSILNRWQALRVGLVSRPGKAIPDSPGHEDERDFETIDGLDPEEDIEPKASSKVKPKRRLDPMTTPPSPTPRAPGRTPIGCQLQAQRRKSV
jgi:hypothetical protein